MIAGESSHSKHGCIRDLRCVMEAVEAAGKHAHADDESHNANDEASITGGLIRDGRPVRCHADSMFCASSQS